MKIYRIANTACHSKGVASGRPPFWLDFGFGHSMYVHVQTISCSCSCSYPKNKNCYCEPRIAQVVVLARTVIGVLAITCGYRCSHEFPPQTTDLCLQMIILIIIVILIRSLIVILILILILIPTLILVLRPAFVAQCRP